MLYDTIDASLTRVLPLIGLRKKKSFFMCFKDDLSCPEVGSISHHGRCYLIAPYPEISWFEANEMCRSMQVNFGFPPFHYYFIE